MTTPRAIISVLNCARKSIGQQSYYTYDTRIVYYYVTIITPCACAGVKQSVCLSVVTIKIARSPHLGT